MSKVNTGTLLPKTVHQCRKWHTNSTVLENEIGTPSVTPDVP